MKAPILKAAQQLREDLEAFALYWGMAHGADITIERLENGKMSLMGACAIASWVLWRALRRTGHDAEIVIGWYRMLTKEDVEFKLYPMMCNHCWVTVDGQLIDLTATQFGVPHEVYVTDPGQDENYCVLNLFGLYSEASYDIRKYMASTHAAAEKELRNWDSQSPLKDRYRLDLQVMEDKVVEILEGREPELRRAA